MWSSVLLHVLVVMMVNHLVLVAPNAVPGGPGNPGVQQPTTTDPPTTEEPSTEEPTTEEPTTTETTTATAAPQPNNRICPANSGMVDATREYKCELEASAATSAQKYSSAGSSLPTGVHENVHVFSKSQAGNEKDAIVVAVKQWWSRIRVTGGIGQGVTYTQYNVGQPTEWFIRMAWATTQHFGCAVVSCDSNWSVVCHYETGGSVGQQIYNKGPACSSCPSNTFCNEDKLSQLLTKF